MTDSQTELYGLFIYQGNTGKGRAGPPRAGAYAPPLSRPIWSPVLNSLQPVASPLIPVLFHPGPLGGLWALPSFAVSPPPSDPLVTVLLSRCFSDVVYSIPSHSSCPSTCHQTPQYVKGGTCQPGECIKTADVKNYACYFKYLPKSDTSGLHQKVPGKWGMAKWDSFCSSLGD